MTILSDSEIRAACERPSKLPATASADDYEMEKYQRVAIEAVAAYMTSKGDCATDDIDICRAHGAGSSCRRCWREYLEAR